MPAASGTNSGRKSLAEFVGKWQRSRLRERSASHSHFINLCEVLGEDSPTDVDLEGSTYTFDKGAEKNSGEDGRCLETGLFRMGIQIQA